MGQFTKKFAVSILAVIFALVAVGTTTFAWFTLSTKVEVRSFEATIKPEDGIEVKLSANPDAPWYAGAVSFTPPTGTELNAVSYIATSDDTDDTNGFAKFLQDGSQISYAPAELSEYIVINVYFRSRAAGTVRLTTNSYLKDGDLTHQDLDGNVVAQYWNTDVAYDTYEKGDSVRNSVGNAARMMIVGAGAAPMRNYFENPASGSTYNTTGLQENSATTGAISYFMAKTGINTEEMQTLAVPTSYASTMNTKKLGVANTALGEDIVSDVVGLAQGAGTAYSDPADSDYYYGQVAVYIWIEGWDAECFNSLFEQKLEAFLQFKYVRNA